MGLGNFWSTVHGSEAQYITCTWWLASEVCVCICISVGACMLSHFSHVWLFATPWTVAMEFSRQEYWSGSPYPPSACLWDWTLNLWDPMLSAWRWCQNWIELQDTQLSEHCLVVWGNLHTLSLEMECSGPLNNFFQLLDSLNSCYNTLWSIHMYLFLCP